MLITESAIRTPVRPSQLPSQIALRLSPQAKKPHCLLLLPRVQPPAHPKQTFFPTKSNSNSLPSQPSTSLSQFYQRSPRPSLINMEPLLTPLMISPSKKMVALAFALQVAAHPISRTSVSLRAQAPTGKHYSTPLLYYLVLVCSLSLLLFPYLAG